MRIFWCNLQACAVLALVMAARLGLAQTSEVPPATTEYLGRVVAQTMHYAGAGWLIRNKREREEGATRMREALELKPGMVVCDMGSGNGYHSLPMAKEVAPGGKVLAVDIQPEMLEMLKQRAAAKAVKNVECIAGEAHDPHLPTASCDLILLVDVYHEFSHPEPMLQAMRKALKPGGQVVLVEFRAEDLTVPIKPEHKMSRSQIMKELEANGFKLTRSFDELPWQHMLWFAKHDDATIEGQAVVKPE
jgi:2-polyprenyl-3-methyl-5-hydroxy-6-metoxy-1,4-benzoquinol methylase